MMTVFRHFLVKKEKKTQLKISKSLILLTQYFIDNKMLFLFLAGFSSIFNSDFIV